MLSRTPAQRSHLKATASAVRAKNLSAGFAAFADEAAKPVDVDSTDGVSNSGPDKSFSIHPQTVYQICNHKGPRRRYVRVVEVYGDNAADGEAMAECEIIHADETESDAELVGQRIQCALSTLRDPDQYPKYQFSPEVWKRKVSQTVTAKRKEVGAVIDAYMLANAHAVASLNPGDVTATLGALAKLLKPIFGGLTLVLMLSWIKRKIEATLPSEDAAPKKSFQQKYSDMFRNADKQKAQKLTFPNPQAKKFGLDDKEIKEQSRPTPIPGIRK
jgi:hypothetical protein